MNFKDTIQNILQPGTGFSQRVVRGGMWVFGLKISLKVIGLGRLVIVARLLDPSDFGLMGIALLLKGVIETFSQTGFEQALIQKKEDISSYLDAAWTVQLLRGFILFAVIYALAPLAAAFFEAPHALSIIRVMGLTTFLHAFTNIGVICFKKELEFNKQFIYQLIVSLVDTLVTVVFAFLLRNVWALVLGWLAGELTGIAVSYILHPHRPKLNFGLNKARELFHFGKWVLGANIVIFFATQGDDFYLGRVLGVTALGFYQMAFRVGNLPSSEIAGMIGKVAFPAYSKLQTAPEKLREAYRRVVTISTLLSIPIAGGIVVLAPLFVATFMGEKWLPVIMPLRILALSGLFRSIAGTGGALFNAIGKPKIGFWLNVVRLSVIVITIYPLTRLWQISGTSLSVLLGIASACVVWWRASVRETGISSGAFAAVLFPPAVATLLMSGVMTVFLRATAFSLNPISAFFLSIILGGLVYLGVIFVFEKKAGYGGLRAVLLIFKNLTSSAQPRSGSL